MKANEIFALARSFLGEKAAAYSNTAFVPNWLNLLLAESLSYENSVRRAEGREELKAAPQITSLEDDIDYTDAITKAALPYGLAFFFHNEDGEKYQAQLMRNAYISGLRSAAVMTEQAIEDVYGGDADE